MRVFIETLKLKLITMQLLQKKHINFFAMLITLPLLKNHSSVSQKSTIVLYIRIANLKTS